MSHDQTPQKDPDPPPFPQPELDDPDARRRRSLDVELTDPAIRANRRVLAQLVRCALAAEGLRHRQVTLVLADPAAMRAANRDFHGADEATDHLGFQYEAPAGEVSGDIYVCPAVCAGQAAAFGETPRRELARAVIHGVLHLGGWRDDTPARRRRMRAREDELLARAEALAAPAAWLRGGRHAG